MLFLSHETGAIRASKHSYRKVIRFSRTKDSSCSPLGLICFCRNTYCIEEPKATCLEAQLFAPPVPRLPAHGQRASCRACGQMKPFPSPQLTPASVLLTAARRPLLRHHSSLGRCLLLLGLAFASANIPSLWVCGYRDCTCQLKIFPAGVSGRGPGGICTVVFKLKLLL